MLKAIFIISMNAEQRQPSDLLSLSILSHFIIFLKNKLDFAIPLILYNKFYLLTSISCIHFTN